MMLLPDRLCVRTPAAISWSSFKSLGAFAAHLLRCASYLELGWE